MKIGGRKSFAVENDGHIAQILRHLCIVLRQSSGNAVDVLAVDIRHERHVFRLLHAAFDLQGLHRNVHKRGKIAEQVHVLRAQKILLCDALLLFAIAFDEGVASTAGLGALAAVAATIASQTRHIAEARIADTECALHEDLEVDGAGSANGLHHLQRCLACEDNAVEAEGGHCLCSTDIHHSHLCRRVHFCLREMAEQERCQAKILHDEGVDAKTNQLCDGLDRILELVVEKEDVEGAENLRAARMGIFDGFAHFCQAEIRRFRPRAEAIEADVHSISAVVDGALCSIQIAGWQQKFWLIHHLLCASSNSSDFSCQVSMVSSRAAFASSSSRAISL